jgi:hypothetical protein
MLNPHLLTIIASLSGLFVKVPLGFFMRASDLSKLGCMRQPNLQISSIELTRTHIEKNLSDGGAKLQKPPSLKFYVRWALTVPID